MHHANRCGAAILALTLPLAAGSASADSWVGGSLGQSEAEEFCDLFSSARACDDDDSGVKAFVGFQPVPHLGLEAFWVDLGEVEASDAVGDAIDIGVDGFGVALLPTWPVAPELDLYGRFGVYAWEADVGARQGGNRSRDTDDGTDPVYGLGGRLFVTDVFALRFEWERFGLDDGDVSLFSVGAELRF